MKLGLVKAKTLCNQKKLGQNILNKSSKTKQSKKSLLSTFACF